MLATLVLIALPLVAGTSPLAVEPRQAANGTTVASRVEDGIQTECKTCPYKLCTNVAAYEYDHETSLTCWTRGDSIVETNIWYKTADECYVTEWDLVEGDYVAQIPYCGEIPQSYTSGASETVYYTECNIIPEFVGSQEDHTKMYKPETDLTLTCYTDEGSSVLGNTRWYKTLSNCYVSEAQIEFVDANLDDCGPIPFMEEKMRESDPVPETPAGNFSSRAVDMHENSKRWLYLTQIGDDQADCLSLPASNSNILRTYPFGDYIVVQCATYSENLADDDQIYLLTDDFCWVNDTLTDPSLIDDELRAERYPNCNEFVDTDV